MRSAATDGSAERLVTINPGAPDTRRLWEHTLRLASDLGPNSTWTLIGGLMVQVHAFEQEDNRARPTTDIDILGDARRRPPATKHIASHLLRHGATTARPSRMNADVVYRFFYKGSTIDILGPDGLKNDPPTAEGMKTFQVPGGTQALRRSEIIHVCLLGGGAPTVALRRPNLLGAILIKARAATRRQNEKLHADQQDLIRLLTYVTRPRELVREGKISRKEQQWLARVEDQLEFDYFLDRKLLLPSDATKAKLALKALIS